MARITVEDCLDKVDNRFELVMISSKRARQLQIEGKDPKLSADNDKPTVIALREIADGLVDAEILNEKPVVELEETAGAELNAAAKAALEAAARVSGAEEEDEDGEEDADEEADEAESESEEDDEKDASDDDED